MPIFPGAPRRLLAVAALLAWAACKKAPPPQAPAPKSALQQAADKVHSRPPCSREIPSHFSPSLPVPAVQDGKLVYKMFFFGRDGNPRDGFTFHDAEGWATFAPDARVLECSAAAKEAAPIPKEKEPGLTVEQIMEREKQVYALTERAAGYFTSGRELSAEGRKVVGEYAEAFRFMTYRGHAKAYLELNPGFWAWVEKNGGGKLQP